MQQTKASGEQLRQLLLLLLLLQPGVKCNGHSCARDGPGPARPALHQARDEDDDDVIISVVVNCLLDASKSYFKQSHVDTEEQQQQEELQREWQMPSDIRQRCEHQVQNVLGSGT